MAYVSSSSVQVGAWVAVNAQSSITYRVYPARDTVEITLGGTHGLDILMNEAGLRHCVTAFTGALGEFDAPVASLPDVTHADLIPSVSPPINHAE